MKSERSSWQWQSGDAGLNVCWKCGYFGQLTMRKFLQAISERATLAEVTHSSQQNGLLTIVSKRRTQVTEMTTEAPISTAPISRIVIVRFPGVASAAAKRRARAHVNRTPHKPLSE